MLGTWLPFALADIYAAILVSGGFRAPKRAATLADWGLPGLADEETEKDTELAIESLAKLGAQTNA